VLRGNIRFAGLLLLPACLVLVASSARATLIDDFSGTPAVGIYLSPPDPVAFGVVLPLGSTNELDFLGDLQGMDVEYSLGGLDLTGSGSNDALSLEMLDIVPSAGPITLAVSVNGGPAKAFVITSNGTVLMPYADFSNASAFSNVSTLKLTFSSGTYFGLAADDLQAIPEPSTLALAGLGLFGLAVAGRRRSRRERPAPARPGPLLERHAVVPGVGAESLAQQGGVETPFLRAVAVRAELALGLRR
jgi:hypothetical protein